MVYFFHKKELGLIGKNDYIDWTFTRPRKDTPNVWVFRTLFTKTSAHQMVMLIENKEICYQSFKFWEKRESLFSNQLLELLLTIVTSLRKYVNPFYSNNSSNSDKKNR